MAYSRTRHGGRVGGWLAVTLLSTAATLAAAEKPTFNCDPPPTANPPKGPPGDYSGQTLTDHNFYAEPAGSLRGANFKNAILDGAVFATQDLTGANFEGASLGTSKNGPVDFTRANLEKTCFVDAKMGGTDFTYAIFRCADFRGTNLLGAIFGPTQTVETVASDANCRTRFNHAVMDVNAIEPRHWGKTDFTDTDFRYATKDNFNLKGQDISGAKLAGTKLIGIDMTGADLSGADLSRVRWEHAKLIDAALNGVKAQSAHFSNGDFTCARFYLSDAPNEEIRAQCKNTRQSKDPLVAADLTEAYLQHANMPWVVLDSASLNGANLTSATLDNATLRGASLASKEGIRTATVVGGSFKGADFSKADLTAIHFNQVHMNGANFDGTTFKHTDFSDSHLPFTKFKAVLQDVSFRHSVLQRADFTGAHIKTAPGGSGNGADFTCAQLGGAKLGNATITAATFTEAVMPYGDDCCEPDNNGFRRCGTIGKKTYGPVELPHLAPDSSVLCPDGEPCQGNNWRLPQWKATQCKKPYGSAQTIWWPPSCGKEATKVIRIKDQALADCLSRILENPSALIPEAAEQVDRIACPGKGIRDVSDLSHFTGLRHLELEDNQINSFDLKLPNLLYLDLSNNELTTLNLVGLDNLVRLRANGNKLEEVRGLIHLAGLGRLETLNLANNRLEHVNLPVQKSLGFADLSGNSLRSVFPQTEKARAASGELWKGSYLTYLDLSHNLLGTIGSIEQMTDTGYLQTLVLSCNPRFRCNTLFKQPPGSDAGDWVDTSGCFERVQDGAPAAITTPKCGQQR